VIIYDLACDGNHTFEGWFQDRASFERQRELHQIECPVCGSLAIEMVPSTVMIRAKQGQPAQGEERPPSPLGTLRMIHDFIDRNFDNVGKDFAETAIRIHRGEEPKRNIRGSTTEREEEVLREEGVEFMKIPLPPKLDS
jgi:hypothetical protein